jgi:thiol-disulfide isomerase/thioredoxin
LETVRTATLLLIALAACGSHDRSARTAWPSFQVATAPAPRADIADLTQTGEAVPIVGVPGKLTVVDFWASWCEPCRVLGPRLEQLAAQHPDRLALRRINVVDWGSPAAEKYLTPNGYGIPHLIVLARDGTVVLDKTSSPQVLLGDVERLLDAPR